MHRLVRLFTACCLLLLAALPAGTAAPDAYSPVQAPGPTLHLPLVSVEGKAGAQDLPYPILFVTQAPIRADFTTIGSTFGNHLASMDAVGRGGDLWIRYPDGSLKNLTQAAGYGGDGFQGASAIAVRDPAMHWDGDKAVFSMVIGAPTQQYVWESYYWQLYEITGLGPDETPTITKVPHQPQTYNNVNPTYGSDDRILFTSDRPRDGAAHLYPQLDEYEEAPTVSGLWSLDPAGGDLRLLNHAPSGDFTPFVDSYGRVIFTQWDHLQRDQQADADNYDEHHGGVCGYCTFNYSSEAADSVPLPTRAEVFPEPRAELDLDGTNLWGHTINHFFPWSINQDGTESEILNHLGRHELHAYIPPSLTDDGNLFEYYGQTPRFNPNPIANMFHIQEDPLHPGRYYGINAPEFGTHSAGQVFYLQAPPELDAAHILVTYVTHPDTDGPGDSADHSGLYRDVLPLADGTLMAVHTDDTERDATSGGALDSDYEFRLKTLALAVNGYHQADQLLTPGISKTISYWSPDYWITYSGLLWELNPVEVRARPRPPLTPVTAGAASLLDAPEQAAFTLAGVSEAEMRSFLQENELALAVTRDVTTRDALDNHQPFNLRVGADGAQTIGAEGKIYQVDYLQFFQADLLRGLNYGSPDPRPGRRVLAQYLHEPAALAANPPLQAGSPIASVELANDGSMAAFVPARRAMSWHLTDEEGTGVVRERYWITFQPGEIRVCGSCHGLSELDQTGNTTPTNMPQALVELLQHWQTLVARPAVTVAATDGGLLLTWPHQASNTRYEVWGGASPFGPAALLEVLEGPFDPAISHLDSAGHFYYVRAANADDLYSARSAWVGAFEFALALP